MAIKAYKAGDKLVVEGRGLLVLARLEAAEELFNDYVSLASMYHLHFPATECQCAVCAMAEAVGLRRVERPDELLEARARIHNDKVMVVRGEIVLALRGDAAAMVINNAGVCRANDGPKAGLCGCPGCHTVALLEAAGADTSGVAN